MQVQAVQMGSLDRSTLFPVAHETLLDGGRNHDDGCGLLLSPQRGSQSGAREALFGGPRQRVYYKQDPAPRTRR